MWKSGQLADMPRLNRPAGSAFFFSDRTAAEHIDRERRVEPMQFEHYEKEWLEPIRRQEELLRTDSFNAEDALQLGLIMERLAREKYREPVAIRIILGGHTAFSYLMEGTDSYNDWWMDKKLNTARLSGMSSLRTLMELAEGNIPCEKEYEIENDYALCGGCFPLRCRNGRLIGYVESSGMAHQRDHQLIADALAELLDTEIPAIEI